MSLCPLLSCHPELAKDLPFRMCPFAPREGDSVKQEILLFAALRSG